MQSTARSVFCNRRCIHFLVGLLEVDCPNDIVYWLDIPVAQIDIVRREDHGIIVFVVEETDLCFGIIRETFRGVNSKGPLKCWELRITLQAFGRKFSSSGMSHYDVLQKICVHDVDFVQAEAAGSAALVGWGKEGNEWNVSIDSIHHFYEPRPLDHPAEVAKVVHRTDIVVN